MTTPTPSPAAVRNLIEASGGILRLAPTWVPRSFLMPGRRIKLPRKTSTPTAPTAAASTNAGLPPQRRPPTKTARRMKGLSYVVDNGKRVFTLLDAVGLEGANLIGKAMLGQISALAGLSKFFDNMGPIPHHMHQNDEQAALVGQQGKPESYYFPPQLNNRRQQLPLHVLRARTRHDQGRHHPLPGELEQRRQRHSRITRKAYRLQARHGLAGAALRAARARLAGDLRAAMGLRRLRHVPVAGRRPAGAVGAAGQGHAQGEASGSRLSRRSQLDWDGNVDPNFKDNHYLEPIAVADTAKDGYVDRWIVYGKVDGQATIHCQGTDGRRRRESDHQRQRRLRLDRRARARQDRQACAANAGDDPLRRADRGRVFRRLRAAAKTGVTFENTGSEPLVVLRYFGPDVNPQAPRVGDHKKK